MNDFSADKEMGLTIAKFHGLIQNTSMAANRYFKGLNCIPQSPLTNISWTESAYLNNPNEYLMD